MINNPLESPEALDAFLAEAKRLLSENPTAMQVNLIAATDGRVYSFFRYDLESEEQEDLCLRQMGADQAQAQCIVCMWSNGCLDMLRYSLRKKLTDRYPDACLLLFGEKGISAFPLSALMHKK